MNISKQESGGHVFYCSDRKCSVKMFCDYKEDGQATKCMWCGHELNMTGVTFMNFIKICEMRKASIKS